MTEISQNDRNLASYGHLKVCPDTLVRTILKTTSESNRNPTPLFPLGVMHPVFLNENNHVFIRWHLYICEFRFEPNYFFHNKPGVCSDTFKFAIDALSWSVDAGG